MRQFLVKVVGRVIFRKTCVMIVSSARQTVEKVAYSYTLASMPHSVTFPKAYK